MPLDLDGSGSVETDPGDFIALYEWDFETDGVFDFASAGPAATHAYPNLGLFDLTLRVTDTGGLTDTASTVVIIGRVPVSEPTTLGIFAFGIAGLGYVNRRRRRAATA